MTPPMRPGPGSPPELLASIPFSQRTIASLLRGRAADTPDHPVVEVDGELLTWAALEHRSRVLAAGLASAGVERGDVVCQMAGNTAGHVVAAFAVARLGAVECPLNTGLRGEPLRHVLGHSGARALLVETAYLERVEPELARLDGVPLVVVRGTGVVDAPGRTVLAETELSGAGELCEPEIRPQDAATIIYTSGTTGPAKGVVLPHHFAFTAAAVKIGSWGLGASDVLFSPLPLFHANARYSTLLTACVLNARAVVVERFSATRFWDQVRKARATEVGTVGTIAPILLERPEHPRDRDHEVRMVHGAGALDPAKREVFERRFGVRLVTGFSMTETSHFSTTSPDDPGRHRAAGRPVAGFAVAILDDQDQSLPPGQVGEIAVRPEMPFSMLLGYHRDPQATVEAFRNLWFHTGDLGLLDQDGYLHWVDRRKDAIRRKGEMVSSRDVEVAALRFPGVVEAAAIGVPGELGEEEVALLVRCKDGDSVQLDELLRHCQAALPDFAVPRYLRTVESFPRTATHKIDKRALREASAAEPAGQFLSGVPLPKGGAP